MQVCTGCPAAALPVLLSVQDRAVSGSLAAAPEPLTNPARGRPTAGEHNLPHVVDLHHPITLRKCAARRTLTPGCGSSTFTIGPQKVPWRRELCIGNHGDDPMALARLEILGTVKPRISISTQCF